MGKDRLTSTLPLTMPPSKSDAFWNLSEAHLLDFYRLLNHVDVMEARTSLQIVGLCLLKV